MKCKTDKKVYPLVKESQISERTNLAASEIVHQKLVNHGGKATVYSIQGNAYEIRDEAGKNAFSCDQLPIKPPYGYRVFDIIVELLERQGGRARKGMGRKGMGAIFDLEKETAL